jgi:hypothetical protein
MIDGHRRGGIWIAVGIVVALLLVGITAIALSSLQRRRFDETAGRIDAAMTEFARTLEPALENRKIAGLRPSTRQFKEGQGLYSFGSGSNSTGEERPCTRNWTMTAWSVRPEYSYDIDVQVTLRERGPALLWRVDFDIATLDRLDPPIQALLLEALRAHGVPDLTETHGLRVKN